jgi:hypothetical protein
MRAPVALQWAFQAAMSDAADGEVHTHDPPPPQGSHLDRFGFVCAAPPAPVSKEEAALELRRVAPRWRPRACAWRVARGAAR